MPSPSADAAFGHLSRFERAVLKAFSAVVVVCLVGAVVIAGLATHSFRAWVALVAGTISAMLVLMAVQGRHELPGPAILSSIGKASLLLTVIAGGVGGLVAGLILPSHPLLKATLIGAVALLAWNLRERVDARLYGSAA